MPPNTSSLPTFPRFTFLEAHHQADLVNAIKGNPAYSDYNFISLWSWDHQKKLQLCLLNNNLVIRFQDYLDPDDYFYSFFGEQDVDETAKTLLHHSAQTGRYSLKLIPQFVVDKLERPADFLIAEDRDSFDYIVASKNSADSSSYSSSKRRALNKLLQAHGHDLAVEELDITQPATAAQIIDLVKQWQRQSTASSQAQQDNEQQAIQKLLDNQHLLDTGNLHILGLRVAGDLQAFSINEILEGGFAMGHFKKASRDHPGLGVALDHFTAKSLLDKGVSHLNHEQDLGIEGLRKAKLASHPVYFLKKYTVTLAPNR